MKFYRRNILSAVAVLPLLLSATVTSLAADKEIRIGALVAASGPTAFIGASQKKALEMLVGQLNAAGGISGHRIALTLYDTEGNTTLAVQQFRRLVDSDRVDIVVGPSSTGESMAISPIANESGVPLISFAGAEAVVVPPTPYVFKVPPTDRIVASYMIDYMKKQGIRSVALLSSADGYGQAGATIAKEAAAAAGVTVAAAEEFGPKDTDMTPQVLKIRASGADAMLIWSVNPGPTIVLKNAVALGYTKPIFNSYGAASPALIQQAGGAAEGSYVSSMRLLAPDSLKEGDAMRPVVSKLADDYRKTFGEDATTFIGHPADALRLVIAAMEKNGGVSDREALAAAIRSGVSFAGANGMFEFSDGNHNGLDANSKSLIMLKVENGKFTVVD